MVKLFEADIVIGGGILQYFHEIKSYDKDLVNSIMNKDGKVLFHLGYTADPICLKMRTDLIEWKSNYIIPTTEGPIFIQANHPSNRYGRYSIDDAKYDGTRIKEWYGLSKGNGEIRLSEE